MSIVVIFQIASVYSVPDPDINGTSRTSCQINLSAVSSYFTKYWQGWHAARWELQWGLLILGAVGSCSGACVCWGQWGAVVGPACAGGSGELQWGLLVLEAVGSCSGACVCWRQWGAVVGPACAGDCGELHLGLHVVTETTALHSPTHPHTHSPTHPLTGRSAVRTAAGSVEKTTACSIPLNRLIKHCFAISGDV